MFHTHHLLSLPRKHLHNLAGNRFLHCCHTFRSCLLLRHHPMFLHNPGHNRSLDRCHMFRSCLLLHHHPMFLHNPGHNRFLYCCHMFRSCLLLRHHSVLPHSLYTKNYPHHILHTRLAPRFHPKYLHSLVCNH